jgi:uncharacterized protein YcbK (DUF882 family)
LALIDRRKLLGWGLGAAASLTAPAAALAVANERANLRPMRYEPLSIRPVQLQPAIEARRIVLKNLHTDEALDAVYWERGAYVPDALAEVNKVLRDYRTGQVHPIHPDLLDLVSDLHAKVGSRSPIQVISGYRSPQTNAMLHERSGEVAKHSLHMDGMAIDLHLQDVDLAYLHRAALDMGRGGVGYYPSSDFVHVDVGRVRHWQGA